MSRRVTSLPGLGVPRRRQANPLELARCARPCGRGSARVATTPSRRCRCHRRRRRRCWHAPHRHRRKRLRRCGAAACVVQYCVAVIGQIMALVFADLSTVVQPGGSETDWVVRRGRKARGSACSAGKKRTKPGSGSGNGPKLKCRGARCCSRARLLSLPEACSSCKSRPTAFDMRARFSRRQICPVRSPSAVGTRSVAKPSATPRCVVRVAR